MNERQIEIIQDKDPYTRIPNALIEDDRLRLQTKMVLIMMLSVRPDWDFSIRGMAKIANVTKDTMSKMMTELEEAGYVKRKVQGRAAAGQFAKAGYLVAGKPIFLDEPCPNLPYTDEPYTINSPQVITKQVITEQVSNTPLNPPEGGGAAADADQTEANEDQPEEKAAKPKKKAEPYRLDWFEAFWRLYPRKDNKQTALRAWCKLKPDRETCGQMAAALERDKQSRQWTKDGGEFIPMPSTWINQRRWENEGVDLTQLPQVSETGGYWAPDPEVTG